MSRRAVIAAFAVGMVADASATGLRGSSGGQITLSNSDVVKSNTVTNGVAEKTIAESAVFEISHDIDPEERELRELKKKAKKEKKKKKVKKAKRVKKRKRV